MQKNKAAMNTWGWRIILGLILLAGLNGILTTNNSSRPRFNQPAQPLPPTGIVKRFVFTVMGGTEAPLTIVTRANGYNYFVKVVEWSRKYTALTIFIRSGEMAKVDVPLGSYKIKYAAGKVWYGEPFLFGPETSYSEADKKFDFEVHGNQVSGYTLNSFYNRRETCGLPAYQRHSFDIR